MAVDALVLVKIGCRYLLLRKVHSSLHPSFRRLSLKLPSLGSCHGHEPGGWFVGHITYLKKSETFFKERIRKPDKGVQSVEYPSTAAGIPWVDYIYGMLNTQMTYGEKLRVWGIH